MTLLEEQPCYGRILKYDTDIALSSIQSLDLMVQLFGEIYLDQEEIEWCSGLINCGAEPSGN